MLTDAQQEIYVLHRAANITHVHNGIESFSIEGGPIDTSAGETVYFTIDADAHVARIVRRDPPAILQRLFR